MQPIATPASKASVVSWTGGWSAWMAPAWSVADTAANRSEFGVPWSQSRRERFPATAFRGAGGEWLRMCCSAPVSGLTPSGEITLAREVLAALRPGMLCLADRQFFGHALWRLALDTGADLLWRVKYNLRSAAGNGAGRRFLSDDGLSQRQGPAAPHRRRPGACGRVSAGRCGRGRAALSAGDHDPRPGQWRPRRNWPRSTTSAGEIEGALAELKTHLRGAQIVLRSTSPELVRQEFWGLLLAHFAVRGLMHEAALRADEDPDRLSFLHTVRVVRRKLPLFAALPPSGQARPA